MKRSLHRQLSISLMSAILFVSLIAAIASFVMAYLEAKEFQDDMLRQIASFHPTGVKVAQSPPPQGTAPEPVPLSDPEARITVFHLPGDPTPAWLHNNLRSGFHTVQAAGEELRAYIGVTNAGARTVAAQPTAARNEVAVSSAMHTLIPLIVLLPVLVWLIIVVLRKELAPITQMAAALDAQSAERPQPLNASGLPDEIAPFVQAINRMLVRVELLVSQQRRFVADAAHELRSPLTALSLQVENVLRARSLDAVHERVAPLQDGIERARVLTEQLLNLARTQAGSSEQTVVDVSSIARELIAEFLPLAEHNAMDLGLDELAPLSIFGSEEALRLIIRNGLDNALRHTPAGGEVTVRLLPGVDYDTVEIVDSGLGLPASERERVFDPFYRAEETHGEGSGLGLAIAREAAARLGGVVSLHQRPNAPGLILRYRQEHNQ